MWLWLCAIAYLVARTVWRRRREAQRQQLEREAAVQQRAEEEWARCVIGMQPSFFFVIARSDGWIYMHDVMLALARSWTVASSCTSCDAAAW